ncbi:nuclear transport factor 2 family protein [Gramella sp. GC03-9]|uniref:Nuclear transport factor 2 family protein n=1 Tax=Christiangramia oceanisediminis TaxID=2920386 RepID=A0A9X2L0I3_9FLAO|nr:nuclear transport factor 2 family protein [Gramella oceanisediminis]MCP9201597.1 nuclear transport factor 2 family protein [Gramella oceanisediminis]
MMKNFMLFFLILGLQVQAQSTDEQQLKDLIQNSFDEVFSELNVENIDNYFTDDFLLLEVGEVWDMERLTSELKSANLQGMQRVNEFDFVEVKVAGNTAWIAYHNDATFKKDGETIQVIRWLESATAVKTERGWRIDMLHSTRKRVNAGE